MIKLLSLCVRLRLFFCSFLFLATSYVTYIGESPIEYTHKMCKVLHATIFEMCVLHGDQRYNKTSIGSTLNRWWFLPFLFTLSFLGETADMDVRVYACVLLFGHVHCGGRTWILGLSLSLSRLHLRIQTAFSINICASSCFVFFFLFFLPLSLFF